jgi:hypothetical protein
MVAAAHFRSARVSGLEPGFRRIDGRARLRLRCRCARLVFDEFSLTQDLAALEATPCIDAAIAGLLNLRRSSCVRIPSGSCGRPPSQPLYLVIPSETSRFHPGCAGQENRLREIPLGCGGSQKEQATGAAVESARPADPILRRFDRIPEQLSWQTSSIQNPRA